MTIVEYYEEFMTMQACCGLNVADDVLGDRYFHGHGLRTDKKHILAVNFFDNVDEII